MSLSFSLLVYPLLFVFGYAFSSVLHFVIEDYFDEYAVSSLFFHYSYIRCFACILVLSVVISAILFIWKNIFFYDLKNFFDEYKSSQANIQKLL